MKSPNHKPPSPTESLQLALLRSQTADVVRARRTGLSAYKICNWKTGRSRPSLDDAVAATWDLLANDGDASALRAMMPPGWHALPATLPIGWAANGDASEEVIDVLSLLGRIGAHVRAGEVARALNLLPALQRSINALGAELAHSMRRAA